MKSTWSGVNVIGGGGMLGGGGGGAEEPGGGGRSSEGLGKEVGGDETLESE